MLTRITISKRKDVTVATKPTHDLVASDDNYQNKTIVGALWTKVSQDAQGNDYKFLSGGLQKERTVQGKTYDGYVIITEKEYNELKRNSTGEVNSTEVPPMNVTIPSQEDNF